MFKPVRILLRKYRCPKNTTTGYKSSDQKDKAQLARTNYCNAAGMTDTREADARPGRYDYTG